MRIAYFMETFPKESETFILRQVCAAVDAGHEVFLFPAAVLHDVDAHNDVEVYRLLDRCFAPNALQSVHRLDATSGVTERAKTLARLPALIRRRGRLGARQLATHVRHLPRLQFDVVHAHFGPSARRAAMLIELGWLSGPLVATFHGFDVNVLMRRYPSSIYRPVFDVSEAITVGSSFMRSLVSWMGAPDDKLRILPMGIPVEQFGASQPDWSEEQIHFVTVGRLSPEKAIDVSLRALAHRTDVPWRYHIVGDGPERHSLERLALELGIDQHVTFHGFVPNVELPQLFASSHVYLHPSRQADNGAVESQGVALAEAHGASLPAVSVDIGGIPDTLLDGVTGYLAENSSVDAFSSALNQMLEVRAQWPKMGSAARQHAKQRFALDTLNAELMTLYENVASK